MAAANLTLFGERTQGQDVRTANVTAVQTLSNILRSSLGPQGLDKMLVDEIGDVTITNDGATILKQLEVEHPAAKVLVNLSQLQDQEVGDGTTSVVIIAAELLKRANTLIQSGIHATNVIAGYKRAMKEAVSYIKENLGAKVDQMGREVLINIAKTSLNSKYIGAESDFFSNLIVDAIQSVKMVSPNGKARYPVKAVSVLKTHGQSAKNSLLVNGCALQTSRAANGMPTEIVNAKIAFLDFNLRQYRMQLGVQVLVDEAAELEKIREKERDITKEKIQKILGSGCNVVLTSQGIDDMSLKYFVEAGVLAVRRVDKKDLKRIAKATDGRIILTMSQLDSEEESFDATALGTCGKVEEKRVGDWDYIFLTETPAQKSCSLVLRGSNDTMLDEVERSTHDALMAVSKALESNDVVCGGGAVESALAVYFDDFARTLSSREQAAVAEFAEALLVIPKTLSINAAQDSTDLIAQLKSAHAKDQRRANEERGDERFTGLDLVNGKLRNCLTDGVVEPMMSKVKSLRFATEAAISILRIDDVIKCPPEPEPQQ